MNFSPPNGNVTFFYIYFSVKTNRLIHTFNWYAYRIVAIFDQYQIVLIRLSYLVTRVRHMEWKAYVQLKLLETQIICVCSTLIVNSQEPTAFHTWMIISQPIVLSYLRSAARFAKPYGSAHCKFCLCNT